MFVTDFFSATRNSVTPIVSKTHHHTTQFWWPLRMCEKTYHSTVLQDRAGRS
jgi:hypothetical protein